MAKISIILPSLNHEKYIAEYINSVLIQTEQDFELIIIDDCSTDNNINIIKSFNDDRIKLVTNEYNIGINASFLKGVKIASSEICVFMSTDDIFHKNYIKEINDIYILNKNIDIVYTQLQIIDEFSKPTGQLLKLPTNVDKFTLLKHNFYEGHLAYIPGMAMKKDFINKHASFAKGLLQYADLQLHIEALLYGNIYYLHKPLILYRTISTSASARNVDVFNREICETNMLMDTFLQIKDTDLVKKIFKDEIPANLSNFTTENLPFILGVLALNSNNIYRKRWGYETIIKYYSKNDNSSMLYEQFNIQFRDIISFIKPISTTINKKDKKIMQLRKKRNISFVISAVLFILLIISLLL